MAETAAKVDAEEPAAGGAGGPAPRRMVRLSQLLDGSAAVPAAPKAVIVYGNSAEALAAMAHLTGKGVPIASVRFVVPVGPVNNQLANALEAAGRIGVGLPKLEAMTLEETLAGRDFRCIFMSGDGESKSITCDYMVCCDEPEMDPVICTCLNDSSIVYDGEIVVDAGFHTNDPRILAGGHFAKFSRKYGMEMHLGWYNQTEVGGLIAASLLGDLGLAAGDHPDALPELAQPALCSVHLPDGKHYAYAGDPFYVAANKPLATPEGGRLAVSIDAGQYVCLGIDEVDCVAFIVTCGDVLDVGLLARMVGLHISYLGLGDHTGATAMDKLAAGGSTNLAATLRARWVDGMYHDKFQLMRQALLNQLSRSPRTRRPPCATRCTTRWCPSSSGTWASCRATTRGRLSSTHEV